MKYAYNSAIRIAQRRALMWMLVLAVLTVAFQNCGRFETSPMSSTSEASLASGGSDLQPPTDRVSTDCFNDKSFDACLFRKNPVAARKQAFLGTPSVSESVDPYQTYGVKLTGLSGTGLLENSTLKILSTRGLAVTYAPGDLRYHAQNDGYERVAQLMAYYWMNRAKEYIELRTGVFYAKDKALKVYVDDTIAGWAPATNSIHLKVSSDGNQMAWNGDLAVHFLGLANLHYATHGAISNASTTTHRSCGSAPSGCCTSTAGCARAISSGVGDYFTAMLFPDQPTIGETWANRLDGLGICTVSRDLGTSSQITANGAYNACNSPTQGEVSTMGTVYATLWWNVRKAVGTTDARDIDTLFMQHLALLDGSDDFKTALVKIKSVDARLFAGKYSPLFDAQATAKGL